MTFVLDRQGIANVATRNKHSSVESYVQSLVIDTALADKVEAAADRVEAAFLRFSDAAAGSPPNPVTLSSTVIKIANSAGTYVQFNGTGFKFASSGNLAQKFSDFGTVLANLAGDANTTLKSVTFGLKSGVVGKLDLTSTEIKLTVGKEVVSIKGDFPTKLGQIYKIIKETTGLDSSTGLDLSKLKLLALKPGSELSKFGVESITVTSDKTVLANAVLSDSAVTIKYGKLTAEINGKFPGDAADVYTALRELVTVNKSGQINLVKALSSTASLHQYDIDSISLKNGSKVIASVSLSSKAFTIQIGDYRLSATGTFPHSAGDIAKLILDSQAGKISAGFTLKTLSLVDLKTNAVLAEASGKITSADANRIMQSVSTALGEGNVTNGTGDVDKIVGSVGADFIYGLGGNDELRGGGGNDYIDGGAGDDKIYGGSGADRIFGGSGNDEIYGDSGHDELHGGAGNDKIFGGTGNDTIYGNSGNDELHGEDGDDVIYGDSGDDVLHGGAGNDTLYGGTGNDKLNGGVGNDKLYGDDGDDEIYGDDGDDLIYGGAGNDQLFGGNGDDTLYGDGGRDILYGNGGSDTLYGGGANDTLYGDSGHDFLFGESGNDVLYGGTGNDQLTGGVGADSLYGGLGADRFIYTSIADSTNSSKGRDMIFDFNSAEKDKIDVQAIDANANTLANNKFTFIGDSAFSNKAGELRYQFKGGDTWVTGDVDGDGKADFTIVLDNEIALVATDFIL